MGASSGATGQTSRGQVRPTGNHDSHAAGYLGRKSKEAFSANFTKTLRHWLRTLAWRWPVAAEEEARRWRSIFKSGCWPWSSASPSGAEVASPWQCPWTWLWPPSPEADSASAPDSNRQMTAPLWHTRCWRTLSAATEKPSRLQRGSSGLASTRGLTREGCVGESAGAPLLLAATKSCRAWQCKPMKNCTRGRRCTAPGSLRSGKALLPPSAGSLSLEPSSFLATRFSPVSAMCCASLRAERGHDPSRGPVVLRLEIPVKVLATNTKEKTEVWEADMVKEPRKPTGKFSHLPAQSRCLRLVKTRWGLASWKLLPDKLFRSLVLTCQALVAGTGCRQEPQDNCSGGGTDPGATRGSEAASGEGLSKWSLWKDKLTWECFSTMPTLLSTATEAPWDTCGYWSMPLGGILALGLSQFIVTYFSHRLLFPLTL